MILEPYTCHTVTDQLALGSSIYSGLLCCGFVFLPAVVSRIKMEQQPSGSVITLTPPPRQIQSCRQHPVRLGCSTLLPRSRVCECERLHGGMKTNVVMSVIIHVVARNSHCHLTGSATLVLQVACRQRILVSTRYSFGHALDLLVSGPRNGSGLWQELPDQGVALPPPFWKTPKALCGSPQLRRVQVRRSLQACLCGT